jgi:hypothetical protein
MRPLYGFNAYYGLEDFGLRCGNIVHSISFKGWSFFGAV